MDALCPAVVDVLALGGCGLPISVEGAMTSPDAGIILADAIRLSSRRLSRRFDDAAAAQVVGGAASVQEIIAGSF
jgi:hypothetical protein